MTIIYSRNMASMQISVGLNQIKVRMKHVTWLGMSGFLTWATNHVTQKTKRRAFQTKLAREFYRRINFLGEIIKAVVKIRIHVLSSCS